MTHGLCNHTSYIACQDTDLLVQHIVALCEAEGMKPVGRSQAGRLFGFPAQECNTWRIGVHKGRNGWHALEASPSPLFSEPFKLTSEPRLKTLCKSLQASGFVFEIADCGQWGQVLMETDGDRLELSGWWLESEEAQAMQYYGISMPNESAEDYELRFKLHAQFQDLMENGPAGDCQIFADTDQELAANYFAYELGGSTGDPWWMWESCDSVILYFSWPLQDRPEPEPTAKESAEFEFLKQDRHFYADGSPIRVGDAVLFHGGRLPGQVRWLSYGFDGVSKCLPTYVDVRGPDPGSHRCEQKREFEDGLRFTDLILVERKTADFMQAGLKLIMDRAEQGDAQAQFNLGSLYMIGQGVKRDPEKALDWWRQAASLGHEEAQKRLLAQKSTPTSNG